MRLKILFTLLAAVLLATAPSAAQVINEDFADITTLPAADWFMQNNSQPIGVTNWFQGNDAVFPSQAGAPTAYIGANFNNTTGTGTISNWLLTPTVLMVDGDDLVFWTRGTGSQWPDRLQVRVSTNGTSTNVGTLATDVGDFTTLLLDINPTYAQGVYPAVWTEYTVPLTGLPGGYASGRLAFRYFVENGGPSGANSDYIGIDTVVFAGSGIFIDGFESEDTTAWTLTVIEP